jgi:SAM-dependent methyltransferase
VRRPRLSALLERPRVYALAGRLLAPGTASALAARIAAEVATLPPGRHLDLGCGPASRLARAGVSPIGVDLSPAYARALRRTGGLAVVARAEALPFRTGAFGAAWSFGLLHHLSDEAARRALAEARRVARSGRIVVFDAVWPRQARRRPLAWALRRLDRGGFMRDEAALHALLAGAPGTPAEPAEPVKPVEPATGREPRSTAGPSAAGRCRRFTYSWTGLEALWYADG